MRTAFFAAMFLLPLQLASANLIAQSDAGFISQHDVIVKVTPGAAFAQLVAIADWWSPAHSYSNDAKNLSLTAAQGGCFCETWPGGSVEHMRIVSAMPGSLLRLQGALGPLQSMAVSGALSIELTAVEGGTRVRFTYAVGGFAQGGLTPIAAPVDQVLGEQVQRFAARFAP